MTTRRSGYHFGGAPNSRSLGSLDTIQLHRVILDQVGRGKSRDEIARSLHIHPKSVERHVRMLHGIRPEVITSLRNKHLGALTFLQIGLLQPNRQTQCVEAMAAMGDYSERYVRLLLAATADADFRSGSPPSFVRVLSAAIRAKAIRWGQAIEPPFRDAVAALPNEQRSLGVLEAFVRRLLANPRINSYLQKHYRAIYSRLKNSRKIEVRRLPRAPLRSRCQKS